MQSAQFLNQLISFPSVSSTSNVDISRWVESQLTALGFETEWLEYTDPNGVTKACVSGRKGPTGGRGFAYFCVHHIHIKYEPQQKQLAINLEHFLDRMAIISGQSGPARTRVHQ